MTPRNRLIARLLCTCCGGLVVAWGCTTALRRSSLAPAECAAMTATARTQIRAGFYVDTSRNSQKQYAAKLRRRAVLPFLRTNVFLWPAQGHLDYSGSHLREGRVIAQFFSDHAEQDIGLPRGASYWFVQIDSVAGTGTYAIVPRNSTDATYCAPLRGLRIRGNHQTPTFVTKSGSPVFDALREDGEAVADYLYKAEAGWVPCGAWCCCAGNSFACESHPLSLSFTPGSDDHDVPAALRGRSVFAAARLAGERSPGEIATFVPN